MFGKIAILLICHCIYSTLRWRKFLQGNAQSIQSIPVDIIAQAIFGIVLASIAIVSNANKLKKINIFEQTHTYDKALERKNFRTYDDNRGQILQDIVKKRLNITQFGGLN